MNGAEVLLAPARELGLGTRPAIVTGTRQVTYDELDAATRRFGRLCLDRDLAPGARVLLVMDDRPEFFFVYLGAMAAGAVPVAVNIRFSATELAHVLVDSGAALLVVDADFLPLVQEANTLAAAQGPWKAPSILVSDRPVEGMALLDAEMARYPAELTPLARGPDDTALWMYTSGTSGRPKAAVHRLRALESVACYLGPLFGVAPGERIFCSSKLFFAFSLGHSLLGALRLGATAVLHSGWPDAEAVAEVARRDRPDLVFSVPTMYRNLLDSRFDLRESFASVRLFVTAGERLPESLATRWREATGTPIAEGVGATETLVMFLGNPPDAARPGWSGRAMPDTEVRLLDEAVRSAPAPGSPGVLWVRSARLASGYWGQPEKTAEAFQDGWYRTGDVFIADRDGWYQHQGRADDMMKISGQWVSPIEIEERVLLHPDVAEAAVIGAENEQGLVRLALFLVPGEGGRRGPEMEAEILEDLREHLAIYKVPRRIAYLETLPRTTTGKIQRFRLRELAERLVKAGQA
jgi:benzoate-CoA ligase